MEILYYILVILGGVGTGIVAGLLPGLHTNTIAAIFVAFYVSSLQTLNLDYFIIFIVSVAIANAFFDIFPTLFLGVPASESYALVPAHQLSRKGYGKEVLSISNYSSLLSFIFSLLLCLIFLYFIYELGINILENIDKFLRENRLIFWILLAFSAILILSEEHKFSAFFIFLLSGLFGIIALGSPLLPHNDSAFNAIFPALSGLFGVSSLVLSLLDKDEALPPQKEPNLDKFEYKNGTILGFIGGVFSGFMPGLGAANVAVLLLLLKKHIVDDFTDKIKRLKNFMVITSAINISDTIFGITMLYFIAKSRSGVSVALEKISFDFTIYVFLMILGAMAISAGLSFMAVNVGKNQTINLFEKLEFKPLNLAVIIFITFLVIVFCGIYGLVVLIIATFIGLLAYYFNVRKSQLMGFFLVPTILFFSKVQSEIVSFLNLESRSGYLEILSIKKIVLCFLMAGFLGVLSYFVSKKIWKKEKIRNFYQQKSIRLRKIEIILPILVICFGVFLIYFSKLNHQEKFILKRVIDGDTMVFYKNNLNKEITCRLLGVDTPEKFKSNKLEKDSNYGEIDINEIIEAANLASEFSKKWFENNRNLSISLHGKDRHSRHLCIVFGENNATLNEAIIQNGYGVVYGGSNSRSFTEKLMILENTANMQNLGLWDDYAIVLNGTKKEK